MEVAAVSMNEQNNNVTNNFGFDEYNPNTPVQTGTTIMAIRCKGGVVLAADTRTSAGGYIVNRASRKICPITDKIFVCRCGSAAATQFVTQIVKRHMSEHSMELKSGGVPTSVISAANLYRLVFYQNQQLSGAVILAGYDSLRGPQIYNVPRGGTIVTEEEFAIAGSGSAFISGLLQTEYKPDMEPEEAVKLCQRMVARAMYNDASSGGLIRTVLITEDHTEEYVTKIGEGRVDL